MPNHSGTSCLRCSAWSQAHAHTAYSVVNSGCFTLPHACRWSTSLDTRHIRSRPGLPPSPSWLWRGPSSWLFFSACHSFSRILTPRSRCLLMLQPLNGSLSFSLWEAFSFPRKWHPECFLFPFYFVLKCCQNEFSFKSPSYFGNIVSTKVFLNVYDWGTSQLELKWMCIKIFPLG